MTIKNSFILAISILISLSIQGQNDTINQTNKKGHKYGYWKEYHENGNIKSEGNYKIIERQMSMEEIFFYDLNVSDSIVNRSVKIGEWNNYDIFGSLINMEKYRNGSRYFIEKYSYDENGQLIKTERNGIQTLFGVGKNIEIEQLYFFISGTIGNTIVNNINLNSLSNQRTKIIFESSSDRLKLKGDLNSIESNSKLSIPFTYSIHSGLFKDYTEIIFINTDTNKIKIEIESYGYHLSSRNLQLNINEIKTFRFREKKLLYFREFEECEMKVYKYESGLSFQKIRNEKIEPILTFPLSVERNEIDLKKLKNGEYLLTTIDYRNEIEMMIKLIKE